MDTFETTSRRIFSYEWYPQSMLSAKIRTLSFFFLKNISWVYSASQLLRNTDKLCFIILRHNKHNFIVTYHTSCFIKYAIYEETFRAVKQQFSVETFQCFLLFLTASVRSQVVLTSTHKLICFRTKIRKIIFMYMYTHENTNFTK